MYRSWDPLNTSPMTEDEEQAFKYVIFPVVVAAVIFGGIHYGIKSQHRNEAVSVTKTEIVTLENGSQKQIWHSEDKRGLFTDNTTFIIAADAVDSAYAEKESLALGEFLPNHQLKLADRHGKGSGWLSPNTVNYTMK